MSELTVHDGGQMIGPEMTRQEAQQAVERYISTGNAMRWMLLEMFERKAHKALNYGEWAEFCAEQLGLFYSETYHSHLLRAARVERTLIGKPESCDISQLSRPKLAVNAALELAKLPSPEMQRTAWDQMEALREHGMRTEREYHIGLKKLVAQMLKRDEAAKSESAPALPASQPIQDTPQSKPDFFEAPAPAKAEVPKPQTVKGFTPAPDPEPAEETEPFALDFEDAVDAVDTLYAWLQNKEIDSDRKTRLWVIGCLNEISQWVEGQR